MPDEDNEENFIPLTKEKRANIAYSFKVYLSFLKNYKVLVGIILFVVLFLEARHIAESYLFKVLIDNGTSFAAGTLLREEFLDILMIVVGVFAVIVVSGFIGRWIEQHLVNILESKLIIDLKKKYFNHLIDLDHKFHVSQMFLSQN